MDFIRVSVSFLSFFLYFGRFQRDFSEFLAVFLYNEPFSSIMRVF